MKLGIVIPYRNAENWIGRCLESIKGEFVIFPVNDNSLDQSREIVHEIAEQDKRITPIDSEGRGVSAARNRGLDLAFMAECDYISFLDSDDTYAADAYYSYKAAIKASGEADLIQLNHLRVMPDGSRRSRLYSPGGIYELPYMPRLWVSSCNKLFKMDLIQNIRFDENLSHGEDELFVLECLKRTRKIFSSEYIALEYRKDNPNSLSSSTSFIELLNEQLALRNFLYLNKEDPELCEAVRLRQVELWQNATYKRVIGRIS